MNTAYVWEYLPKTTNTKNTTTKKTPQKTKPKPKPQNTLSIWHKGYVSYKGNKIRSSDPFVATHYPRKIWNNILKIKCEAMILYLKKLTIQV